MSLFTFIQHHTRILLPPTCLLCGSVSRSHVSICAFCQQNLPSLPKNCRRCAEFLTATEGAECGLCLSDRPAFDATYALFPYEFPVIQLIIRLKFQQQLPIADAFSQLLLIRIKHHWYAGRPLPDLILPVPLHEKRLQERGYNQALEIARPLASGLGIPLDCWGAKRIKYTAAQSSLSAKERKENIKHAFRAERDYTGLHIAILDDVITTGHTVAELSRELKAAGANRIDSWCIARRGHDSPLPPAGEGLGVRADQ